MNKSLKSVLGIGRLETLDVVECVKSQEATRVQLVISGVIIAYCECGSDDDIKPDHPCI